MKFSREFLEKMALAYELSPDQEEVFLLRFAYQEEYEKIAEKLNTSEGACLKRMGQVYKKFDISGDSRGKESRLKSFLLEKYQQWNRLDIQRQHDVDSATASSLASFSPDGQHRLESPESPVRWNSPFYIERLPSEKFYYQEILEPGALVRIKGPQKMGKTSLMIRILQQVEKQDYYIVKLNLALVDEKSLSQPGTFFNWFCATISRKLKLPVEHKLSDYQDNDFNKVDCEAYFEDYLLPGVDKPLVLILDDVDRIFNYPKTAEDFCSLLRVFHEYGQQNDAWGKLRLVLAYSTEDIPMDINQSPFNVGIPIELPEITDEQVQYLAQIHGLNWSENQVRQLTEMTGGHPYLVRLALYQIACQEITFEELLKTAPTEAGIYRSYLQQHLNILEKNSKLKQALNQVINSQKAEVELDSKLQFKLHSMGLVKLLGDGVTVSCTLYRDYFRRQLRLE